MRDARHEAPPDSRHLSTAEHEHDGAETDVPDGAGEPHDRSAERAREHGLRTFGLGLLLGAAVGAGVALLMAPHSGEVTRKQLRRSACRLSRRSGSAVADWWEDTERNARQLARRGLKRGRTVISRS